MDRFELLSNTPFANGHPDPDPALRQRSAAAWDGGGRRAAMDIVVIEGLSAQTVIGIDPSEQHAPQPVRMDLEIGVPALAACRTDRIEDTIDYAAVRRTLHALLASHGVQLLEALAERIAQMLIDDFGAHWVRVALSKPAKFDDVASVGVRIERSRAPAAPYAVMTTLLGEGMIPQ